MADQILVVKLPEELSRRLHEYVHSDGSGYQSVQEFIAVATENQLNLEGLETLPKEAARGLDAFSLLAAPQQTPMALLEVISALDEPLFVLTNRLAPIKVAARVLANLGATGEWPPVEDFQRRAALAARALGFKLRNEDSRNGRSGMARRWVAFPVGEDVESSLARFISSFTLWVDGERSAGPLAVLGLAGVRDDRAALSQRGWELATLPSPLIDNMPGNTLSDDEALLFVNAITSAPSELQEVQIFLRIVEEAGGAQVAIDRKIRTIHNDWSENRAAAQRSAMIGRLGEIGVLAVEGRGPKALVRLLDRSSAFTKATGGDHEGIEEAVRAGDGTGRP